MIVIWIGNGYRFVNGYWTITNSVSDLGLGETDNWPVVDRLDLDDCGQWLALSVFMASAVINYKSNGPGPIGGVLPHNRKRNIAQKGLVCLGCGVGIQENHEGISTISPTKGSNRQAGIGYQIALHTYLARFRPLIFNGKSVVWGSIYLNTYS